MDFVMGLLMTFDKHNAIWVIMDRLTKSTHFILIRTNFSLAKLCKLYIREVVKLYRYLLASCQIEIHSSLIDSRLASKRL